MRSPKEIHSIIKKISEREGFPISHILKNISYYSDKYSVNIDKKELADFNNSLKMKLKVDDYTKLKLDIFV